MPKIIVNFQKKVLKLLTGKMDDFYLAGGTALSLFYFNHRESQDLDFFTREFNKRRIEDIIKFLSAALGKKINLKGEQNKKEFVKIAVYFISINMRNGLKLDFVEDRIDLVKPFRKVDGINILSLEDIYLRKIYASCGMYESQDIIGRKILKGSRQEAKDFFDLYYLSHTFHRLSEFSLKCCSPVIREGIVRWFHNYSRMDMKMGLQELALKKAADYNDIERHFKKEIFEIIEKEVDLR